MEKILHPKNYVLNDLKTRIMNGKLKPNEKLDSEFSMMEIYGVSRTSIREAYAELRSLGLIQTIVGKGSYVSHNSNRFKLLFLSALAGGMTEEKLVNIFEFRIAIEKSSAYYSALRATDNDIAKITKIGEQLALNHDNPEEGVRLDIGLHYEIARSTGNPYIKDFIEEYFMEMQTVIKIARFSSDIQYSLAKFAQEEHNQICLAIADRDPNKASEWMQIHLKNALKRMGL